MAKVNVYLNFNGNCKEAFDFYKSVFERDFGYLGTYGEMPEMEGAPPVQDGQRDKIMHISLPISEETALFGADTGSEWSGPVEPGNNFTISVSTDTEEEARKIFERLSQGGTVSMPLDYTFWQSYFGMLKDKFGIQWMVNCELSGHSEFEQSQN
jgi:PhnB protein